MFVRVEFRKNKDAADSLRVEANTAQQKSAIGVGSKVPSVQSEDIVCMYVKLPREYIIWAPSKIALDERLGGTIVTLL